MEKYIQNTEIVATELDESLMMMSIEHGKYYELNSVSKRIWELFETPNTKEGVISSLLKEYDITRESCEIELDKHIEELLSKKIIFQL